MKNPRKCIILWHIETPFHKKRRNRFDKCSLPFFGYHGYKKIELVVAYHHRDPMVDQTRNHRKMVSCSYYNVLLDNG